MGTKIHKGLWLDCKVCPHTAEELQAKREKRERFIFRRRMRATTLETAVRRQVAYELNGTGGEELEVTPDQKFQVLQKYGIAAPRIDRAVNRPKWMSEGLWKAKRAEWFQATRGLVPKEQFKKFTPHPSKDRRPSPAMSKQERESQQRRQSQRYPQRNQPHDRQNSNAYPKNFAQTKTATRPS